MEFTGIEAEVANYYLGAIAIISLIMEVIRKIDLANDSWSLEHMIKIPIVGIEISYLKLIGGLLSLIGAAWKTIEAGYPFLYIILGWIVIFFSEYGAAKIGWKNIFSIAYKIIKAIQELFKK
jgi:hypothetical protein